MRTEVGKVALEQAPEDFSSRDLAGHPGMYRRFRSVDLGTRRETVVTDVSCPGCGTVWMLGEGLMLREGTVYDAAGGVARLAPYCCSWSGTLREGWFVPG